MPIGSNQYLITCQPNLTLAASTFPCADINGQFNEPVITQSYLIDTTQQTYFDGLSQGFDYQIASALFAFGFTGMITLWWVGIVSGRIIKSIWG